VYSGRMTSVPTDRTASVQTTFAHGSTASPAADAVIAERHAEAWRIKAADYRNLGGGAELAAKMSLAATALQRAADELRKAAGA
jgi:hypothetical protein